MKKFLFRLLLIGALFFLVDKAAYFILEKTKYLQSNKKLEKIIDGNLNYQLLVLGSSRGVANVDTGLLEKQTGFSSYNISFRGADIVFQEFVLSAYLKYNNPPKALILVIDNPYTFEKGGSLSFRYDRMYPLAADNYINNKLIEKGKHSYASKFLYLMRLHSNQFRFDKVSTINDWVIDEYGTQLMPGQSLSFVNYKYKKDVSYRKLESQEKIESFQNIFRISRENSIDLHIVFPPNFNNFNHEFKDRILELEKKTASYYYYNLNDVNYRNKKLYFDSSHLNTVGARYFTNNLSDYLTTVLDHSEK